MAFEVLIARAALKRVESMTRRERKTYEAVRDSLRGQGCVAGGYRLAARDDGDYPMCCRHLARSWRMFTAFPGDKVVIIVALDKHDPSHNPAAQLSEVLPELSVVGRKRSMKPPCCESPSDPPEMNSDLRDLVGSLTDDFSRSASGS